MIFPSPYKNFNIISQMLALSLPAWVVWRTWQTCWRFHWCMSVDGSQNFEAAGMAQSSLIQNFKAAGGAQSSLIQVIIWNTFKSRFPNIVKSCNFHSVFIFVVCSSSCFAVVDCQKCQRKITGVHNYIWNNLIFQYQPLYEHQSSRKCQCQYPLYLCHHLIFVLYIFVIFCCRLYRLCHLC